MILEYKNYEGYLKGYINWNIIDFENKLDVKNGKIISINGTWIHRNHRKNGLLKRMIKDVFLHDTTQNTLYVLYGREKYRKESKLIPISKFLKYIGG